MGAGGSPVVDRDVPQGDAGAALGRERTQGAGVHTNSPRIQGETGRRALTASVSKLEQRLQTRGSKHDWRMTQEMRGGFVLVALDISERQASQNIPWGAATWSWERPSVLCWWRRDKVSRRVAGGLSADY